MWGSDFSPVVLLRQAPIRAVWAGRGGHLEFQLLLDNSWLLSVGVGVGVGVGGVGVGVGVVVGGVGVGGGGRSGECVRVAVSGKPIWFR